MDRLDDFIRILTGHFDNREQFEELKKENEKFPYAEHVNTICNDKIRSLPEDFAGYFMVEESYYTIGGNTHGSPHHGVISPNTFTSAAPRTYSTICIGSESCLGSIVGFARLPCFGTLRSIISAKVAQGELLRLCPGSSGRAPQ